MDSSTAVVWFEVGLQIIGGSVFGFGFRFGFDRLTTAATVSGFGFWSSKFLIFFLKFLDLG